jgi:adenylate cyclase class 2
MNHGTHETEIKLAVPDAASARKVLRKAGFAISRPRVFEANTVFDTEPSTLRASSRLLRIRTAGRVVTFTYKGPPSVGRHKSREELETTVADAARLTEIVKRLGFEPKFRYEKYRTEFKQPRKAGIAVLDETPIGTYLELEGREQWIDRTARQLGFTESDYITTSYGRLYLEWCAARQCEAGDMVFA